MPICRNCKQEFPNRVKIEDEWKVLNSRKFCLNCSPYRMHNTSINAPVANVQERKCSKCGVIKPLSEFYKKYSKQRTQSGIERRKYDCKSCHNEQTKLRLKDLKKKAVDLKGGKCCLCGYSKSIAALDFHHLESDAKEFKISGKFISFSKLIPELNKCILVCSNCHREIHAGLVDLSSIKTDFFD